MLIHYTESLMLLEFCLLITLPPLAVPSIAISLPVCLSVCLSAASFILGGDILNHTNTQNYKQTVTDMLSACVDNSNRYNS